MGAVCRAIEGWIPEDLSSESVVESSLALHLSQRINGAEIRRQFAYDRIRADLLIEETVAIEIKLNLRSTNEFQRLIGQLETYARWGKRTIVLLVGETDENLQRRIKERLLSDWGDEDCARVVHVPAPAEFV